MKRDSMAEQAEQQSVDYLLTAVRSAVGPIPVVGPLISELAGVVVPNQRIDRISKFVVELEQRVRNLEFRHEIVNQLKDEHFTDLLEEGIRQAARSLTDDRRRLHCIADCQQFVVGTNRTRGIETSHTHS